MDRNNNDIHLRIEVGEKIKTRDGSYIKIMAIEDGYVMARKKGCIPFCQSINGFVERIRHELK